MGGCRIHLIRKKGGGDVVEMTTGEMVRKVACGCHGDEGGDEVVMWCWCGYDGEVRWVSAVGGAAEKEWQRGDEMMERRLSNGGGGRNGAW
ncbi:hypothetical protein Tco_1029025 [Tanacetum coccineum]|uniref:Uncharacterized protein n=1 Tax=Tanacetum coccineum TaxID=301880 RepID=A0ABQ5G3U4_9ASTR